MACRDRKRPCKTSTTRGRIGGNSNSATGDFSIGVSVLVDPLTSVMLFVVTFVGFLEWLDAGNLDRNVHWMPQRQPFEKQAEAARRLGTDRYRVEEDGVRLIVGVERLGRPAATGR